jgi:hypothetical protein
MIDHRALAAISLAGVLLDLLGGLYLAYDLLGGRHGPLRTLTRTVTYSALFAVGYGLPLGPTFGLVAGVGLGLALGLEFRMAGAGPGSRSRTSTTAFAALRGLVQGTAAALTFDLRFGAAFGVLSALGLALAYALGFSPSHEYRPGSQARLSRHKVVAAFVRGVAIGGAGLVAGILTHEGGRGPLFGLEIGLVVAAVGTLIAWVSPTIEWWADALPAQRLGALGAVLVLLGFALQSLQYWIALFNVQVR